MKKLLTAIPVAMMMTGGAFAASTALDNNPTPWPAEEEMSAEVNGIFADDEGNMRSFDDFSMRYVEASAEQKAEVKRICDVYVGSDAVTSPRVKNRCMSVMNQ